jgi:hypothetical protein
MDDDLFISTLAQTKNTTCVLLELGMKLENGLN